VPYPTESAHAQPGTVNARRSSKTSVGAEPQVRTSASVAKSGRRAGFRSRSPQGGEGSNPSARTALTSTFVANFGSRAHARTPVATICRHHGIRWLALFGSALGDDPRPQSDVDLLVEFDPGSVPGLLTLAGRELELAGLFGGREIELRTPADLSPHFREDVQTRAVPLYAAA
jgi:predicted nucleotidyltransferase